MSNYQNVTPTKLGQVAASDSYVTLYTTPVKTKTYVKQFDIVNTTSAPINFFVHIVPFAGEVDTSNALFYNAPLQGNSTLQWTGVEIMEAGDTIKVKSSAVGCTVTASGGEAV